MVQFKQNYLTGEKQPVITEVWVVYGYYVFSLPIPDPYLLPIVHTTYVSRLQLLQSNAAIYFA